MEATLEVIKQKVGSDPKWASKAIVRLFEEQTASERISYATTEKNGRGFNGVDAEILSSFAGQIQRGRSLSPKQLAIAYKKLPKYAKQLLELANTSKPEVEAQMDQDPIQSKPVNPNRVGRCENCGHELVAESIEYETAKGVQLETYYYCEHCGYDQYAYSLLRD